MTKHSARRAQGLEPIETISELAKLVDRDHGTVSRWLKREDWPFPKHPPFQRQAVPKILRWVADNILQRERAKSSSGPEPDDMKALRKEKIRQEIRKLHSQADTADTALARERGRLLDAAEVEREWASIGAIIRNACQSLPSQIVPLALSHGMPHEAAAGFHQQVMEIIAGILRRLSSDGAEDDEGSEAAVLPEPVPAGAVVAE